MVIHSQDQEHIIVPGLFFFKNFYSNTHKYIFMILTAATLKEILENVPGEYEIEYHDINRDTRKPISDTIEIDVSGQKIILK